MHHSRHDSGLRCPTFATLLLAVLATAFLSASAVIAADPPRPNVLFILADDLGWGDLGCYGHPHIQTPNLDRLASQGTLFTNFYVNASVCSPSRCAFFTGQYPARQKIHGHYATPQQNASRDMSQYLDPQVPNVAALLKTAGYSTAHVGKWHLGSNSGGPEPDAYGFDYVGSGEGGGADGPSDDPYYRARSSALFVDEAIAFLRQPRTGPFYLQLWTLVPHATLNPTNEQMARYAQFRAGNKDFPHASAAQIFYSSVTDLDTQLGRLFDALDELGVADNTIVLFSSDNGPEDIHARNAGHSGIGSAGPFRGRKRSLYEGGIRVPGIVRWPGHVPAGVINDQAILSGVDWLPTVCSLAGVTHPQPAVLDGENMTDVLAGAVRERSRPLCWEWRFNITGEPFHRSPQLAIRDGQWKLLMNPDRSRIELYDLPRDPTQLSNCAADHPEIVARLSQQVLDWAATLPEGRRDPNAGQILLPGPRSAKAEPRRRQATN